MCKLKLCGLLSIITIFDKSLPNLLKSFTKVLLINIVCCLYNLLSKKVLFLSIESKIESAYSCFAEVNNIISYILLISVKNLFNPGRVIYILLSFL